MQQPGHRTYVEAARLCAGLWLESSPTTRSGTTCSSVSSTAWCGIVKRLSPPCERRASKCRARGKEYITALDPATGERWRLKGRLYADAWWRESRQEFF